MNIKNMNFIVLLFLMQTTKADNPSFEQFVQDNPELLKELADARKEWDQSPEVIAMWNAHDMISVCATKNTERKLDGCEHLYKKFCALREKAENIPKFKKYREKLAQAGNQYKESVKTKN